MKCTYCHQEFKEEDSISVFKGKFYHKGYPTEDCLKKLKDDLLKEEQKTYKVICPICQGEGRIEYKTYNPNYQEYDTNHLDCPHCLGVGRFKESVPIKIMDIYEKMYIHFHKK